MVEVMTIADSLSILNTVSSVSPPQNWSPKFLCRSFKSPIVLSDGSITTCTLDHRGRNRLGSIFEDDFDSLIRNFGEERLLAMAEPLRRPMCHDCFTKLPRWHQKGVPRAGWMNEEIGTQEMDEYRKLFDPEKLTFNIELSSACNLRCIGCAHADSRFRFSRSETNIDMDRLMEWLGGNLDRIEQIRLYHMGETWAHPRWFEFCRFLKEANPAIKLFTSTNGMLLNSEEKLRQVIDSGIDHVMFSIHGAFQESTKAYMGETFHVETAFAIARELVKLRGPRSIKPYLSWKYLLFEWNDSDEEINSALRLLDDIGFDEIHFTITSQPAPSKRYLLSSPAWDELRVRCAALWPRAKEHQRVTPMEAVYPGRRHIPKVLTESSEQSLLENQILNTHSAEKQAVVQVCVMSASDLIDDAQKLLDHGRASEAISLLQEFMPKLVKPTAGLSKLLGDALFMDGQPALAINAYEAALRIDPQLNSEFLYLGLARSLRVLSRYDEAVSAYETALRIRAMGGGRAYGEDIYLELREVNLAIGHTAAAATAYQCWMESTYLIEHKSRVVYCPIAKNASTFLKTALVLNSPHAEIFRASGQDAHVFTRQPHAQFRLGEVRYLEDRRYFSFLLLREPLERIISAYLYVFVRPLRWRPYPDSPGRVVVHEVSRHKGTKPDYATSITFEEFVHHLARTTDADMDHHWRPQSSFFRDISLFDLVGCLEQLSAAMDQISRRRRWVFPSNDQRVVRNPMPREHLNNEPYHRWTPRELADLTVFPKTEQWLTDDLRELISHRYASDIELYRSRFGDPITPDELVYPTGGALALHGQPTPAAGPLSAVTEPTESSPPDPPDPPDPPHTSSAVEPAMPMKRAVDEVILYAASAVNTDATGMEDKPLTLAQAIREAVKTQAQGVPVRVVLLAGIYREQISASGTPTATAPLVIEAESGAEVIINGADIWSGWQESGGGWRHAWPHRWGLSGSPPDYGNPYLQTPVLMRRREMLIVDGVIQRQVLDPALLVPGAYHVDEELATISLLPMPGVSLTSARVEVATRVGLLHLSGFAHLSLRGLRFQYDASGYFAPQTSALQLTNCTDVLIEDCLTIDNNNKGVQIDGASSRRIVLRRVTMNHNGCMGLLVSRASELRLEDCETSFNNWRGNWCGFYRGSPCGMKVMRSRSVGIFRHRALRNLATGIWVDEDNHDVSIAAAEVYGNLRGIHIEATTGPVTISGSSVVGNRQEPVPSEWRWAFGSGIAVTHAQQVSIQGCFLTGNDVAQIGVRCDRKTRLLKDTSSGEQIELFTTGLHLFENTVVADLRGGWFRIPNVEFDNGRCFNSLNSDGNHFIGSASGQDMYLASSGSGGNNHTRISLAEWRALSNNDGGSTLDGHV